MLSWWAETAKTRLVLDSQGMTLKKLAWKFERVKQVDGASEGIDEGLGDGVALEIGALLDVVPVLAVDDTKEEFGPTLTVMSVTPGS